MKFLTVGRTTSKVQVDPVDTKAVIKRRIRNHGTTRTRIHGIMIANHGTTRIKSHGKTTKLEKTCFTFSKDVKFFYPAGFYKSIFAAVCKLLQEKVEQAKKAGADNAKTINAAEKDKFTKFFNIPENVCDEAITQIDGEAPHKNLGSTSN